jgi:hypothetical protein
MTRNGLRPTSSDALSAATTCVPKMMDSVDRSRLLKSWRIAWPTRHMVVEWADTSSSTIQKKSQIFRHPLRIFGGHHLLLPRTHTHKLICEKRRINVPLTTDLEENFEIFTENFIGGEEILAVEMFIKGCYTCFKIRFVVMCCFLVDFRLIPTNYVLCSMKGDVF